MKRTKQILADLKENAREIETARKQIDTLDNKSPRSTEDEDVLAALERKEFQLHMDNSRIYDKLMEELENEDNHTRKYIKQQANELLKVGRIDV